MKTLENQSRKRIRFGDLPGRATQFYLDTYVASCASEEVIAPKKEFIDEAERWSSISGISFQGFGPQLRVSHYCIAMYESTLRRAVAFQMLVYWAAWS